MAELDLNHLIDSGGLRITSEHEGERDSRLRREEADARAERHKDLVRFYVILLATIVVGALAIYVAFFNATASADAKQWAMGVLTALVAGPGGYLLGQKSK